ncbi:hypothetical protein B9P99_06895 [Candidatus Marsarchaeota G1 archaeon OSP_B]|jgi:hypothetical protein|uniref:Uncharacterized protein n=3 Tax=Candidatus Marsarchaeota group 1 TaxID=2203770 RepID=A0A2R6ANJ8_9ARCH|nr:MAG: hypothetical protein B9P99_06895 [Candidatus Marsarchaeota G1 archaeon OSP_B]PSN87956.1 MAG: hypothetical protein B9Q00_07305 [Candidatus Marsarchaeota G1 archaeon OSP_C]
MDKELFVTGFFLTVLGVYFVLFGAIYYIKLGVLHYTVLFSLHPFWSSPEIPGAQVHVNMVVNYFGVVLIIAGIFMLTTSVRRPGSTQSSDKAH